MELFVSYESPLNKEKALNLAKELGLKYLNKEVIEKKKYNESYFFIYQSKQSFIRRGLGHLSKDIYCNFLDWSINFNDPLLTRCLKGLPDQFLALDATAGFGKDALEIAKNPKCKSLLLIEREKWLFYLLQEGINNATGNDLLQLINKFSAENTDSFKHLTKTRNKYDLIYIDPMFSGVGKSKAKRTIQALRDLTQETDTEGLLNLAIKKALKRVIVKRHKNSTYLEDLKPSHSIKGKVVRYDIYNTS